MRGISCVSGTVQGRLRSLARMVDSVRNSIGDGIPYEIILVACSCDEVTHEWIRSQQDCVLLTMEAQGAVPAFNKGFGASKYDHVATLNDDITVKGATLRIAHEYLLENPQAGQVAFAHLYQNRKVDPNRPVIQRVFGYPYGQCCMTRRVLGERAGWWGDDGLVQYGGDNRLSCCLWRMGYAVVPVHGCAVIDWEIEDHSRERFSHQMRKDAGGVHPDTVKFMNAWRGVLPPPHRWIPARTNRVLIKARQGNLRTLRFKAMMGSTAQYKPRTALIDALSKYGPTKQANQYWAVRHFGGVHQAQRWFPKVAAEFQPDLILLQGQRPNAILPATVPLIRKEVPEAFICNFDADTHYPMEPFHANIARECDLQLTISPDLFGWYTSNGAWNVAYWPIGVEREFIDVDRYAYLDEKSSVDVIFLGTLYGEDKFPEGVTRREAVRLLYNTKDISLSVYGGGWGRVGVPAGNTLEDFEGNPVLYGKAKMALSISQTRDLWGYTSDRLYNISASGCPPLVQCFSGMEEHGYVDGKTCIAWDSFDEMVEKARYYKSHPAEREAIGRACKAMLLLNHTWDIRVEQLFDLIAGLGE